MCLHVMSYYCASYYVVFRTDYIEVILLLKPFEEMLLKDVSLDCTCGYLQEIFFNVVLVTVWIMF